MTSISARIAYGILPLPDRPPAIQKQIEWANCENVAFCLLYVPICQTVMGSISSESKCEARLVRRDANSRVYKSMWCFGLTSSYPQITACDTIQLRARVRTWQASRALWDRIIKRLAKCFICRRRGRWYLDQRMLDTIHCVSQRCDPPRACCWWFGTGRPHQSILCIDSPSRPLAPAISVTISSRNVLMLMCFVQDVRDCHESDHYQPTCNWRVIYIQASQKQRAREWLTNTARRSTELGQQAAKACL